MDARERPGTAGAGPGTAGEELMTAGEGPEKAMHRRGGAMMPGTAGEGLGMTGEARRAGNSMGRNRESREGAEDAREGPERAGERSRYSRRGAWKRAKDSGERG